MNTLSLRHNFYCYALHVIVVHLNRQVSEWVSEWNICSFSLLLSVSRVLMCVWSDLVSRNNDNWVNSSRCSFFLFFFFLCPIDTDWVRRIQDKDDVRERSCITIAHGYKSCSVDPVTESHRNEEEEEGEDDDDDEGCRRHIACYSRSSVPCLSSSHTLKVKRFITKREQIVFHVAQKYSLLQ